ncbi:MAG: tetratricopeptide repeat protein [Chitinophagaceae bacterium]
MKKQLLLVFIAAGFFNILNAQQKKADSLMRLLSSHAQNDTAKVDLMNELAQETHRSNSKLCDSLLETALNLSDQLKYSKGKGRSFTIKATRYYDLGQFPAAGKAIEEAKPLLQSVNDIRGLASLYRAQATLLMEQGNYAGSLDFFLQGLKLAQQSGDMILVVDINRSIGYLYNVIGDDKKAIPYQTEALKQAQIIGYRNGIAGAYNAIGKTYKTEGNYPASLEAYTNELRISEQEKDTTNIFVGYSNIGDVYEKMGKYKEAFSYLRPALGYYAKKTRAVLVPFDEWVMGKAFTHSGNADSGYYYGKHSLLLSQQMGWRIYLKEITFLIAESAAKLNKWDTAYKYLALSSAYKDTLTGQEIARKTTMLQAGFELDKKQAEIALLTKDKQLQLIENKRERVFLFTLLGGVASLIVFAVVLYRNNRQKQKANLLLQEQKEEIDAKAKELSKQKEILQQSYSNVELLGDIGRTITASLSAEKIIGTAYHNVNQLMDASVFGIGIYNEELERIDFPTTYENGVALPAYHNAVSDENRFAALCFRSGKEIVVGDLRTEYKDYLQSMPIASQGDQPVSLIYLPLKVKEKAFGVITVQSFQQHAYSDYHLYMLRNIANYATIALENAESYKKLAQTIESLKQAQAQLIQAEKMASLGQLTAGIAHEIQNPLNFVNNFSEISKELLEEMKDEIDKGNMQDVKEIAGNVIDNVQKINHHGKRADAIVKGMLQHSRTSSAVKEAADINKLADEYLRMAYHGQRAKDKSFNVTMHTDYDEHIGKLRIVPQDIGRVILNLITNAFYAVSERKKLGKIGYEPTVTIATSSTSSPLGARVVTIKVSDNGGGIPEKILDKIFQPFFTTKPSGQGTGLGLSLSYDIVKAHEGELKVKTIADEFTEFIIELPEK